MIPSCQHEVHQATTSYGYCSRARWLPDFQSGQVVLAYPESYNAVWIALVFSGLILTVITYLAFLLSPAQENPQAMKRFKELSLPIIGIAYVLIIVAVACMAIAQAHHAYASSPYMEAAAHSWVVVYNPVLVFGFSRSLAVRFLRLVPESAGPARRRVGIGCGVKRHLRVLTNNSPGWDKKNTQLSYLLVSLVLVP